MTVISNPLLLKKKAAAGSSGYQIEKSLRFNSGDDPYLSRTPAAGNQRQWTWSAWVKRSVFNAYSDLFVGRPSSNNQGGIRIGSNQVNVYSQGSSGTWSRSTTALLRDASAWYHIVVRLDTTQKYEADRCRIYVNGSLHDASGTGPTLNAPYDINSANVHYLGANSPGSNETDGYIADVQFIDGLSLSPAAFGEHDSNTDVWNPKAFAIPEINDGTTWSTPSYWSGTEKSDAPYDNGFDGDTSNTIAKIDNSGTTGWVNYNFTPPNPIKFVDRVEVHGSLTSVRWSINHGPWTTGTSNGVWDTIATGGGTITTINIEADNNYPEFRGIRIDGVELIDGKVDASVRNNLNDGTKWSNYVTGATINSTTYGLANAFNGKVSTAYDDGNNTCPNDNTTCVFKPPNTITAEKSLRVFFWRYAAGAAVYQNNTDITSTIAAATGTSGGGWATLSDKTINTTHGLTWSRVTSGQDFRLAAIEVDGVLLLDSATDNSFHLKFSDTSSSARLGRNSFNKGIEDSSVNGALPIYNTTADSDGYDPGETKGSGYREDNKPGGSGGNAAGTTDATGLLIALPGDVMTDVHASINTGSTTKTFTKHGDPGVSTDQSRFYGSSLKFDGTGDYLQLWTGQQDDDMKFGTGDFTVECWVYKDDSISSEGGIWEIAASSLPSSSSASLAVYGTSSNWKMYCNGGNTAFNMSLAPYRWQHVAAVRSSGTLKLYVDGIASDTTVSDTTDYQIGALVVGGYYSTSYLWKGYIQDFRVYKGVAKYTANFTPPTRNDFPTVTNLSISDPGAADVDYISSGNAKEWKTLYEGSGKIESIKADSSHSSSGAVYQNWFGVRIDGTHLNESGTEYSEDVTSSTGSFYGSNTAPKLFDGNESTNVDASSAGGWVKWTPDGGHSFNSKVEVLHYPTTGEDLVFTYKLESDAVGIDSLTDTPTNYGTDTGAGGEVRGNYATLNPLELTYGTNTFSEGNLKCDPDTNWCASFGTMAPSTGKWYWEVLVGETNAYMGIQGGNQDNSNQNPQNNVANILYYSVNGKYKNGTTYTNYGASYAKDDYIGVALDLDSSPQTVTFYKNNSSQGAINLSVGTGIENNVIKPMFVQINDPYWVNFGQRPFKYTAPSGFKCLCTQNLDDTFSGEAAGTVNNPSKFFDILQYTGDGETTQDIKGVSFQPDLVWQKIKNQAGDHALTDAVRGTAGGYLQSEDTDAQKGNANDGVSAFNTDGFTAKGGFNSNANKWVSWLWDAGTTSWSSSDSDVTAGTFASSGYTNRTAGFSIVTWEGDETNTPTGTVGHNLGAKPELIMIKNADGATHWVVGHDYTSTPWSTWLYLNTNDDEESDTSKFNATAPTSTVFSIGQSGATNGDNSTFIGYCWTPINGYSAFGKYTGNANADGPFVYTGFRPRWFLMKELDDATNWLIYDSERNVSNPTSFYLFPNTNAGGNTYEAANTNLPVDFLSNGFKLRNNNSGTNASGDTYVWAAFAEHPFKIARAR